MKWDKKFEDYKFDKNTPWKSLKRWFVILILLLLFAFFVWANVLLAHHHPIGAFFDFILLFSGAIWCADWVIKAIHKRKMAKQSKQNEIDINNVQKTHDDDIINTLPPQDEALTHEQKERIYKEGYTNDPRNGAPLFEKEEPSKLMNDNHQNEEGIPLSSNNQNDKEEATSSPDIITDVA